MQKTWSEWSLDQWLSSLENRYTQEIQLGLTRIRQVAQDLALLTPDCKVITVTGTNGKGSTVSALESIYHTAGYQVGTYTSPHLVTFNERVRLNTKPVSDDALCLAFRQIELARQDTVLTYFETATLAALWLFKQHPLDIIIIEVGIGGRLDATNIIDPDLSIITTVAYDHQDYLGNTLDAIGYEKAGILRPGKPFIYADNNPPSSILDKAKNIEALPYLYDQDFTFTEQQAFWTLNWQKESLELPKPAIQLKSASAALVASYLLNRDLPISNEQRIAAMRHIFIAGRLQLVKGSVDVLYDVSHNPQSAELLADTLKQLNTESKVHAVFSALKDKDIIGLILPLKDCVDHWYPAQLDTKRAISASELLSHFRDAEIHLDFCYNNPLNAFETALQQAEIGDLIVVYGSFYTVGQVIAAQHNLFAQKEIL